MNKSFCVLPFIHFEVTTSGHYRPCCLYKDAAESNTGKLYNLTYDSLEDIQNSPWLKDIREKMLRGETVPGCYKCYSDEELGNSSRRVRENIRFSDEIKNINDGVYNLRIADIKPGNVCNLRCRICNEDSSSQWMSEKRKWPISDRVIVTDQKKIEYEWFEYTTFWDSLEAQGSQLTHIEIFGGEPFLIKQQFEFLQGLIDKGVSKNISVTYATNGTIFPAYAVENIFPHFKDIVLMVSADGIEDTFEYARNPAKWALVKNNIDKFISYGFNTTIAYSVSIYSIFNLLDSLEYYYSKGIPVWLNTVYNDNANIISLPDDVKRTLTDRFENHDIQKFSDILQDKSVYSFIEYMNTNSSEFGFEQFKKYVKLSDAHRDENILDVIPELKGFI